MPGRFQITVSHVGLGKVRILNGSDTYVLESRARELQQMWNEQYSKKLEMERRATARAERLEHIEDRQDEARKQADAAAKERQSLEQLLSDGVRSRRPFDWESLKDFSAYNEPRPPAPIYQQYPPEPAATSPKIPLLARLIPGYAKRKQEATAANNAEQKQEWLDQIELIRAKNEATENAFVDSNADWETRRAQHEASAATQRASIDNTHSGYEAGETTAVRSFCEMVLSRNSHTLFSPPDFELDYTPETKSLILEYSLPAPEILPDFRDVRYVKPETNW